LITAHAVADALLLVTAAAGNLVLPNPTQPTDGQSIREQALPVEVRFQRIRSELRTNQSLAITQLIQFCAEHDPDFTIPGIHFLHYLLTLRYDRKLAAAHLTALRQHEDRGNALYGLEEARLALMDQREVLGIVDRIITGTSAPRLRRPVWAAVPAPIRAAFLQLPAMMRIGPRLSMQYTGLFAFVDRAVSAAGDDAARNRFRTISLRLAMSLLASDLPWDRSLGYSQASKALKTLSQKIESLTDAERTSFATLEARLQARVQHESFAPVACGLLNGKVIWVRDPFADGRTIIKNPMIFVSADGFVAVRQPRLTSGSPR
jgi:hypothetical protein